MGYSQEVQDFFSNTYGNNIDRPGLEQLFMDQLGLNKSKKAATLTNLLGYEPEVDFPVPGLWDHAMLYDHYGKPHTIVLQPYKSNIELTDEMIVALDGWCLQHNLLLDINQWQAWYAAGRCHVIELSLLPH